MNWESVKERARPIALETGQILRKGLQESPDFDRKSSSVDLVTRFDKLAEETIASRLQKEFPDHGLVAEEGARREGGLRWYVDPLDGTNNFAHKLPHFAVSMALYEDDQPRVALTYDPVKEELFEAHLDGGTRLNGKRCQVASTSRLGEAMLATGFPYDRHTDPHNNVRQLEAFLTRARGVRRMGAATLDLAYVAVGRYDGFWEFKLGPWDVAAGVLLVREAGGRVTSLPQGPVRLTAKVDLLASNGSLHSSMTEILASRHLQPKDGAPAISIAGGQGASLALDDLATDPKA